MPFNKKKNKDTQIDEASSPFSNNAHPKRKARSKTIETKAIKIQDADSPEVEILPPVEDLKKEMTSEPEILPVEEFDNADITPTEESNKRTKKQNSEITRFDPLPTYLDEVRRQPRITKEEEHALAVTYSKTKDRDAAVKLISANLWLVVKIARDYERAARSLLDLIQEGNIGLMEAIKGFDPYRGVRFPSYAVWWIKAYIIRYILANWRMVKIGTTQAQRKLFFNLQKEKEKLERDGYFAAPKLLAEKLDVKESEVVEMQQRLSGADVSMDAPLTQGGEEGSSLLSIMPSGEASAEGMLLEGERTAFILEAIREFGAQANDKERAILDERLLKDEKATLQELASQLSISVERVRQIEERLKEKLKVFILEKIQREKKEDIEVS